MKHLIVLGASGFAIDLCEFAKESLGYGTDFDIKGFMDKTPCYYEKYNPPYPYLGYEDNYEIQKDDVFVCAIGQQKIKIDCITKLKQRNAVFVNLIHKKAYISPYSKMGEGNIFFVNTQLGAGAIIGDFNLVQNNAIIAHDCIVGNYNRIDCNVMCVGGIKIGDNTVIHTNSVINHRVCIGDNATVAACSFVTRNVKNNSTVLGNPSKELKFPIINK